MLKFDVPLPAVDTANANTKGLTTRKLTVTIADGEPISVDADPATEAVSDARFVGDADATVLLSLVDVDQSGNASPAREVTGTLTDTIPPPQPGEFGLRVTGQE